MRSPSHFLLGIAIAMPVALRAQAREARSFVTPDDFATASRDHVYLDTTGRVQVVPHGRIDKMRFQSGVDVPGAVLAFGVPHVEHLLIAGRDARAGRVEQWSLQDGSWRLVSALALAGADFTGLTRHGDALYLLDCVGAQILTTRWDPETDLADAEFQIWADRTTVPALATAHHLTMVYREVANTPGLPVSGVFLHPEYQLGTVKLGTVVTVVDGRVEALPTAWDRLPALRGPIADERTAVHGATSVDVIVSGQQSVEVLDPAGDFIGRGRSEPSERVLTVQLTSPLSAGKGCGVRETGTTDVRRFACR